MQDHQQLISQPFLRCTFIQLTQATGYCLSRFFCSGHLLSYGHMCNAKVLLPYTFIRLFINFVVLRKSTSASAQPQQLVGKHCFANNTNGSVYTNTKIQAGKWMLLVDHFLLHTSCSWSCTQLWSRLQCRAPTAINFCALQKSCSAQEEEECQ